MRLPNSPRAPGNRFGFTLIELLVVIVIIAVLVAISLPVFARVQNKARAVHAINDMRNVKIAVTSYFTDYKKYPINDPQQGGASVEGGEQDTVYGDLGGKYSSADLFNILRAKEDDNYNKNNVLNQNKVVYWDGPLVKDPDNQRSGITVREKKVGDKAIPKGSLVDAWGNEYVVWIDATRDGDLTKAIGWFYYEYADKNGVVNVGGPPTGYAFASLGPDGKWGTKANYRLKNSDDIVTWEAFPSETTK